MKKSGQRKFSRRFSEMSFVPLKNGLQTKQQYQFIPQYQRPQAPVPTKQKYLK